MLKVEDAKREAIRSLTKNVEEMQICKDRAKNFAKS
jgi:hypothetical protein